MKKLPLRPVGTLMFSAHVRWCEHGPPVRVPLSPDLFILTLTHEQAIFTEDGGELLNKFVTSTGRATLNRREFAKSAALATSWGAIAPRLLADQQIQWQRESSSTGALPVPSTSREQTGVAIGRLDRDSPATDFVLSFRVVGPALVWYRRMPGKRWDRYIIEKDFVPLEAGGVCFDVDGDGNQDIVFGNDWQGNQLWWWQNPYPNFDPAVPWKRHLIKDGGATQHHDMIFADLKGTGRPQLIFWNQGAQTIFMAEIPSDPRTSGPWDLVPIFSGHAGEGVNGGALYAEGLFACDIDGDGRLDLLAGNFWLRNEGNGKFTPIKIGVIGGRIRAGKLKPGKYPQIVIAPGDGNGPLTMYECDDRADPAAPGAWVGRNLLDRDLIHGHSLELADIDGDGNLDIVTGEQGKWSTDAKPLDNPAATAWILYGDGKGNFRNTVLATGEGWHDTKVADFDGDGDLDILQKPYAWSAPRVDVWLNNGTAKVKTWSPVVASTVPQEAFTTPVGMELWTYRHELQRDLPGTLAAIRKLNFTDVETATFYGRTAAEFQTVLQQNGMNCSSLIVEYERLQSNMASVIQDAKALGVTYVLASWIPHKTELTEADIHTTAQNFNLWGKSLKDVDLQFGYHPHGFEFVHTPKGTLFDGLAAQTDPALVTFELDTFWFAQAGADPVCFMERYPTRFALMHLKDLARGTRKDLTGLAPEESSVTLGQGELNWPAVLREAKRIGIRRYYIEDESPRAAQQVPQTMAYLRKLIY
jgi:sugar phosphate isomerase/epimerase